MMANSIRYRVIEVSKGKWVPQYRCGREWRDCFEKNGCRVERKTPQSARHWFFWEDGCSQFPDAGNGKPRNSVHIFRSDGKRVPEYDGLIAHDEIDIISIRDNLVDSLVLPFWERVKLAALYVFSPNDFMGKIFKDVTSRGR